MDRYSSSDSPPWRCNSPICISIWWPPSVGSSRSRNRARIRRTNQAATARSANRPNQAIQLACMSLASSSRFPCPTWSASPARDSPEPFHNPPRHIIHRAAVFGKGRCDPPACRHLQKASHTSPNGPGFRECPHLPAGCCRNSRQSRASELRLLRTIPTTTAGGTGLGPFCLPVEPLPKMLRARRVLQGLIAIVATGDNKRWPLPDRRGPRRRRNRPCRNLSHATLE